MYDQPGGSLCCVGCVRDFDGGAGPQEIAMMVPVVFLILPVTVLFAVFPGFTFFRFTL